jgi:D-alanyl-D-alanine carboxypeptidase (penicillin-binding protein 5/6)
LSAVRRAVGLLALVVALVAPAAANAASLPPPVAARAVLIANGDTNEILYERDADRRVPMASITKLMTALVTLESARPSEMATVLPSTAGIGGSTAGLFPGEELTVRDLLAAALVQSANDAAWALAAHVGDGKVRRFVRRMNERAAALGLDDTHFVRPDGLDARGHYSSARDAFELARAAMEQPLIRRLVRMRNVEIAGGRTLHTWNDLLGRVRGIIGVKTGHTDGAGWSQVAAARRDGVTIYAVVLGGPTRARRNADLTRLLEWGFDQFARVRLVTKARAYATAAAPFADERVPLVAREGATAVVRLGRPLVQRIVVPAVLDPPLAVGDPVGEIRVFAGDELVVRRMLVAGEDVPEAGLVRQLGWYAGRTLDELGGILGSVTAAAG